MKYYASVSFGKDSLAMLFMLIDKGYQLDEVVFYDTGMEFQAIYNTRDAVLPILKKLGIKYTELHPEQPFLWTMFERPVKKRGTNIIHKKGYSWCGGTCRWGTSEKLRAFVWHEDGVRLYELLDRVSCWCCGNKNLKELKNMYLYLPWYWKKLKELQLNTDRPYRRNSGETIFDLEERFRRELLKKKTD